MGCDYKRGRKTWKRREQFVNRAAPRRQRSESKRAHQSAADSPGPRLQAFDQTRRRELSRVADLNRLPIGRYAVSSKRKHNDCTETCTCAAQEAAPAGESSRDEEKTKLCSISTAVDFEPRQQGSSPAVDAFIRVAHDACSCLLARWRLQQTSACRPCTVRIVYRLHAYPSGIASLKVARAIA